MKKNKNSPIHAQAITNDLPVTTTVKTRPQVGLALMAAALALPLSTPVHAETAPENGIISLKYLDYLDSQPGTDRIKVKASALKVVAPISGEWSVGAGIVTDSISGASPAFHTFRITHLRDFRRAADADVTRYFEHGSVTLAANISSESDYLSRGFALQGSLSSDDKNTTFTAGFDFNNDEINPNTHIIRDQKKHVSDFVAGVSQVLTPNDIVQLTLGYSDGSGYFSDSYKILDNRPNTRNNGTLVARWNHHLTSTNGTLRWNYRYYDDNWGIHSHTLGVEYVQPVAETWTITPLLRYYSQSAANFYIDADPARLPFTPNPPEGAANFSLDQRLANFGAITYGLKLAKRLDEKWVVDVKFEQYTQRASLQIFGNGSPNLGIFNARNFQLGLARQF
jgi:hypothetical protein